MAMANQQLLKMIGMVERFGPNNTQIKWVDIKRNEHVSFAKQNENEKAEDEDEKKKKLKS